VKHWLLNVLAAVSLMLCVASAGLWQRSASHTDQIMWRVGGVGFAVASSAHIGGLFLERAQQPYPASTRGWSYIASDETVDVRSMEHFYGALGFGLGHGTGSFVAYVGVALPVWAVVAGSGFCAWRFYRLSRSSLRPPGSCARCGYDLRATPDRCPECGAIPSTPAEVRA